MVGGFFRGMGAESNRRARFTAQLRLAHLGEEEVPVRRFPVGVTQRARRLFVRVMRRA